jgi:hypothetical protein
MKKRIIGMLAHTNTYDLMLYDHVPYDGVYEGVCIKENGTILLITAMSGSVGEVGELYYVDRYYYVVSCSGQGWLETRFITML